MADSGSIGDYRELAAWQWTDSDGITIRGRRREAADGAATLHWLSGNGFCGGVYWPFLRQLDARFGLITHDMAGHGEADPVEQFVGVSRTVERVRAGFEQLAPSKPRVAIGHSFGAALSLRSVARGLIDCDALVLLDPIILPTRYWLATKASGKLRRNPMAQAARRRRAVWESADAARERLRDRGIYKGWRDEALDAFISHATCDTAEGRALVCAPELEAQIFENPLYLWRDIPKLDVPTLYVYGEKSYFFLAPSARRVRKRHAQTTVQALPGGHCFMLEDPESSAQFVSDWLGEVLPSG